jgi:signal peptidase I
VLAVALALGLLLKWGVVDGYEVRGNSMHPVLVDRADGADRVAVFKRHFDLFAPRRYDLAVFARPAGEAGDAADLGGDLFIKRIVGLPGEELRIEDGDLFVAPGPGSPLAIARRPVADTRRSLVPVAALSERAAAAGEWRLPDGTHWNGAALDLAARDGRAVARFGRIVHDGWTDRDGVEQRGANAVDDVALELTVTLLEPGTRIVLELVEEGDAFVAELSDAADAVVERVRGAAREPLAVAPGRSTRLAVGRPATVSFWNVDDQVVLSLDGAPVLVAPYVGNTAVEGPPSNEPAFGVLGGAARFTDVRVLRDVFFSADGQHGVTGIYRVPERAWFVLGDNSAASRDSRHFGAVPEQLLRGRPFLRLLPLERFGAL